MKIVISPATSHLCVPFTFTALLILAVPAQSASLQKSAHWTAVEGQAVHYFPDAIRHFSSPTDTGKTERSTDTIDLTGDINGRIIYHVTSDYDLSEGTLTNTGHQVFSGTVMGSQPVMILDDSFRFTVELDTGATQGEVSLDETLAGIRTECHLTVIGSGLDAQGNGLARYHGKCRHFD